MAEISLPTDPDGISGYPLIEFERGAPRLWIAQPLEHGGLWGWVAWHAPTLAFGGIIAAVLVLLWFVRRVARRPQRYGQYYCLRCNYDLTAPGGMPPDSLLSGNQTPCPECGVNLLRRKPRLARSTLARLWIPLVATLLIMIAGFSVMGTTLERYTPMAGQRGWLPLLTKIPGFPKLQRHRDWTAPSQQRVIWQDLPKGEHGAFSIPSHSFGQVVLSTDARWLASLDYPNGTHPSEVIIYDLADHGAHPRLVPFMAPASAQLMPAGFSADGQRLYVHVIIQPQQVPAPVAAGPAAAETVDTFLYEVTLASGETRQLATVHVPYTIGPSGVQLPTQRFAVKDQGGRVHWALFLDRARGTGPTGKTVQAEVMTEAGATWPVEFAGTSWYPPELSADLTTLDIPAYAAPGTGMTISHVKLADGTVSQSVSSAGMLATSTSYGAITVSLTGVVRPTSSGILEVRNTQTQAILANLDYGPRPSPISGNAGVWPAIPTVSADDHWAAVFVTKEKKSLLQEPEYECSVLVWDLSAIPAPHALPPDKSRE